jgi:predicted transcriptional regulator
MTKTDNNHSTDLATQGAEHYPETLRITVESADEMFGHAIEQAGTEAPADEAVRSFDSIAAIRQLLTDRRLEVMRSIMTAPPESISQLADRLERNYADVHTDVQVLADHHIVYFKTDGRAKQPVIPYDRVRLDVEVVGGPNTETARA